MDAGQVSPGTGQLGHVLVHYARFDEAIRHFRRAVELDDLRPDSWRHLAETLELAAKPIEAFADWREAVQKLPDKAAIWNGLAWFLVNPAGTPDRWPMDLALFAAEQAVALSQGTNLAILNTLGVALYRCGELDRA
jgi:tetratricopeptide (TPR) repeat protein